MTGTLAVEAPNPQSVPHASAGDPQTMLVGSGESTREIAFMRSQGAQPGLVWLPGFMSEMQSSKASALAAWAQRQGRALLRFDYSGHGLSRGRFEDGTIGQWLEDGLAVIRAQSDGPVILVGSSMGAWLALLVARALADVGETVRLHGMVLIAPAVDFTESLMWQRFSPGIRDEIDRNGVWMRPSDYGAPYPITRGLIEEGRRHLLLGGLVRSYCPVQILQGMQDPDVPWQHAMALVEHLAADPVAITLVKDADHRLARPQDIARMLAAIAAMAQR